MKSGKSACKTSPMSPKAASRIQSAGDRSPSGPTGQSGFGPRAQSAGARNASAPGNSGTVTGGLAAGGQAASS